MATGPATGTVAEFERELARRLNDQPDLLPPGLEVASAAVLAGHDRKQARKRRGSADLDQLRPGDSVFLVLRPRADTGADTEAAPAEELLRALAEAERVPGHAFVSLKWFRDTFLPRQPLTWVTEPDQRQQALAQAMARGWILVDKVANPKHPAFPTTAVRIDRTRPETRRVLGESALGWDFTPIQIPGEPMSETLLRQRG